MEQNAWILMGLFFLFFGHPLFAGAQGKGEPSQEKMVTPDSEASPDEMSSQKSIPVPPIPIPPEPLPPIQWSDEELRGDPVRLS